MPDVAKSLGPVRVWALAAGGMVGGGIYVALGVVISAAAQWAWLSFVIAGLVAVITAYSYAKLSVKFGKSGGAFEFLEEMDRKGLAGSVSWLLIIGYTLTISVYAYAFGHYVAYAFAGGALMIRGLAIVAGLGLIGLNLTGLGRMTMVEVIIVSGNLLILVVLAVWGLAHWDSVQLVSGIQPRAPLSAMVGAAGIFVSYEGFQLLTYEYEEIRNGKKTFVPVLLSAAIFVVLVYVAVTLGATMLAGALTMVEQKQVALSVAAQRAYGGVGLVALTIAAAFATAAAINSTLFSTGKLAQRIARSGDLPGWIDHNNRFGVPDRPIALIGLLAIVLAVIGSLSSLVEAASLVFLSTFIVVNVICFREIRSVRWVPAIGAGVGTLIGLFLLARLVVTEPVALTVLVVLGLSVFIGRPALLRHVDTESDDSA